MFAATEGTAGIDALGRLKEAKGGGRRREEECFFFVALNIELRGGRKRSREERKRRRGEKGHGVADDVTPPHRRGSGRRRPVQNPITLSVNSNPSIAAATTSDGLFLSITAATVNRDHMSIM